LLQPLYLFNASDIFPLFSTKFSLFFCFGVERAAARAAKPESGRPPAMGISKMSEAKKGEYH
jgi:hypothetical protein